MSVARFIADQRTFYRVPYAVCCAILGVSVSWLYKWVDRAGHRTLQRRRAASDAEVLKMFKASTAHLRLAAASSVDLLEAGWTVSVNTVADSMRRQGLQGTQTQAQQGIDEARQEGTQVPGPARTGLHRPGAEPEVVRGHNRDPDR